MVCVVVYDLGEVTPFKTSGYHGLTAGGPDRNTDNSAEKNNVGSTNCVSLDVVVPTASPTTAPTEAPTTAPTSPPPSATASATATPTQAVQGATSQPSGTPPATATLPIDTPNNGNALPFALLLLITGSGLFTVLAIKPIRESRRDR
jgi:hypothetical protein